MTQPTDPTLEAQDTGDIAAVPVDQQVDTDDQDDEASSAEPVDLSDVADDGEVVDIENEPVSAPAEAPQAPAPDGAAG